MTNGEHVRQLSDDDLAEWLCRQIFRDHGLNPLQDMVRYHAMRNFLKMDYKPEEKK